jgi:hypothetical protein
MTRPLKVDWANRKKKGSQSYRPGGPKGKKKKPGIVPKDASLSQNTTPILSAEDRRQLRAEEIRVKRARAAAEKTELKAQQEILDLRIKLEEAKKKAGLPSDDSTLSIDQLSLASKMLSDLRWVYGKVDGRQKLLDMVKDDDKQFAFIIKELLRLESDMLEKNPDGTGGNIAALVVIKGLHDQERVDDIMRGGGNEISNERIAITMDNPDGSEGEHEVIKDAQSATVPVVETPAPPKTVGKYEKIAEEDKW